MHFLYLFNLFVILSLYCFYNLCLVSCFEVLFENHIFLWKSFLNKDDYYLYLKVLLFLPFTAARLGLTLINTLHGEWSVSMSFNVGITIFKRLVRSMEKDFCHKHQLWNLFRGIRNQTALHAQKVKFNRWRSTLSTILNLKSTRFVGSRAWELLSNW